MTELDGTLVLYLPPDGFGVPFGAELSCPRPDNRAQSGCHQPDHCDGERNRDIRLGGTSWLLDQFKGTPPRAA
ncbi:hypothetical protein ACIP88_00650 [Streptomyces uncialis]|uniref:hypothetical protein n=1 Tax=Streptomyces uncialis TaxID=1048205 RepID=UPI00382B2088